MMTDAASSALSFVAFIFPFTNTLLLLGFLSDESFSNLGVYFTDLKPSWLRVTVRAYSEGFCSTKVSPPYKIEKHGSTSLLTAVHHPPLDTTVWMDISRNPGPISEITSNAWDQVEGFNSHNPA